MESRLRSFSRADDLPAMLALARLAPAANLHIVDLPYRLSSWALDDPANVGLWTDDAGRLLAWAVVQTPFWTIDYACHPDAEAALHPRILAWAEARTRQALDTPSGRPCWLVSVFADQAGRIHDLETASFACQADVGEDSWSKVLLRRSASPGDCFAETARNDTRAGFAIRPLLPLTCQALPKSAWHAEAEVAAYVALHRSVFESKNMTIGWRQRTLRQPAYRPDLDLGAVAPDGRLAAFCIAWLDRGADGALLGQIEPLGVHADFRGLGLGRAILAESLRRLHRAGATQVYVETDQQRNAALRLYEAAGFRPVREVLVYRKEFAL